MTQTLGEFLTGQRADRETILQAARYAVAELSDDLPVAEMREELTAAHAAEAEAAMAQLQSSLLDLTEHALAVLSLLWYDLDRHETVRQAVNNAQTKMPVIEVSVIASAVLYGIHLWLTKGVKRTYRKIEMRADGTYVETSEVENFSPRLSLKWGKSGKPET